MRDVAGQPKGKQWQCRGVCANGRHKVAAQRRTRTCPLGCGPVRWR